MRTTVIMAILTGLHAAPILGAAAEVPWWKEQKLVFTWVWDASIDEDRFFRNAARSGCTVYLDASKYSPDNARRAKAAGLKYFAGIVAKMRHGFGDRTLVTQDGGDHYLGGPWYNGLTQCPLDEAGHEQWIVEPYLEGIREGLIDGLHTDWEYEHLEVCYCDDCFARFLAFQGIEGDLPGKAERFAWLEARGLVEAYRAKLYEWRVEMLSRLRQKLQAVKPDLLFSCYPATITSFTEGMKSAEVPFVMVDHRHYWNDERQPWWESYGSSLRKMGYLYVPLAWTNSLFGTQASRVSAARWIYEVAIHEDGASMYSHHELGDDVFRAYAAADREIKAVTHKMGDFLFHGEPDPHFVTAVEWTGRPELERAVIQRTYHRGNEHLAHINNVDPEWPLRARIRFPRLPEGPEWTVRDPLSELYYTQDGKSSTWTRDELRAGVVVTLEPRSDLFLRVSPLGGEVEVPASQLLYSRELDTLFEHAAGAAAAQAATAPDTAITAIEGLGELLTSAEKLLDLPKGGWLFKRDEQEVGIKEEWFRPQASRDGWTPMEIESFWGEQGGTGAGWYRADLDIPALPAGRRLYLHFGAIDEELILWIDGERVGDFNRGPDGWDLPFAIEVTDKLTAGRRHFALRVYNSAAAGGVWKPVSVLAGPVQSAGPRGRLVYTATEPMGLRGLPVLPNVMGNAIRTVAADGENSVRLRQLRGHLWSPRYSPDGQRIAFVHDAGGRGQIFVMNADGSGAVNLSRNDFCDRSPVWSPDGARIAFVSDREGDWEIWVMNADGRDPRRLAGNVGLDRAPAWSPDGRRLAWESHVAGIPNLWVCDADGGNSRPVIADARRVPCLPRWVRGANATPERSEIFPDPTPYLMDPVWSPDGTRLAAVAVHGNPGRTPVVLEADGSLLTELLFPSEDTPPFVGDLCWSPDGTRLAAAWRGAAPGHAAPSCRSGLCILVPRGPGADEDQSGRVLVDVSPQGPRLGGPIVSAMGLQTWYAHGSALPSLVPKTFCSVTWSPDGQTLAFSSDLDPSGAFYVYTISPEGGEPQRIEGTRSAWPQEVMWHPR